LATEYSKPSLTQRLLAFTINLAIVSSMGMSLPAFAGNQAAQLNNDGVKLLNAGNFPGAIAKFEEALRIEPGYQYAKDNLAIAYNNYALKQPPKEAIKYFHKALAIQPGNATTSTNLDQSVQLLGKNPKSFKDRVDLGKDCRLSGDFDGAIVEFQAALKIQNDAKLHKDLGDVLRVRDRTDEAVQEYQAALSGGLDDANKAGVWVALGQCYQAKKDLKNAIAAYGNALKFKSDDRDVLEALKTGWEEALRENPQAPENHIGLGQAYQYSGDFGMAEAEYKQALVFDPNNQIARKLLADLGAAKGRAEITKHINTGVDLQLHKQYDEAIKEYMVAFGMASKAPNPDAAGLSNIWVNIGSALQAKEDYGRAVQSYEKALQYKADNAVAQQGIKASKDAWAAKQLDDATKQAAEAYKAGRYAEALTLYQNVLKTNPNDAGVHFNIAAALQQLNRIDEAIIEYKNAVRLDDKNDEYKKYLETALDKKADPLIAQAVAAHKAKDYTKAIDLYQQAIAIRPKRSELYYNVASAYYSRQQYDLAKGAYSKALELDPKGQVGDLWFIGTIDEHFGKGYDAMAGYKKYLAQAPTGTYAQQAKDRLEALTKNPNDTVKIKSEDELAKIKDAGDAYQQAYKLQTEKQYDQAEALYNKAISLQPTESGYPYALATLYFAKGDIDKAMQWVDKAIALDGKNKDYAKYKVYLGEQKAEKLVNAAVEKQKAEDFASAVQLYQQALQLVPNNARVWTNLGSAIYATDDFNGALNAFQKAVSLDAKAESQDFYSIGLIQENFKRTPMAIEAYRKFLQYNPTDKLAPLATDRVKVLTADPTAAKALPTHSEAQNITAAQNLYDQGVKAQEAKNFDQAIELYKQAMQKNPKEAAYPFAVGSVYQAKDDMATAGQFYAQAAQLDPKNPDYKKYLEGVKTAQAGPLVDQAAQKFTAKDYQGAIALYRQALQIVDDANVHVDLASALQATDDFAGARQEYQKALQLNPKNYDVLYFLGALTENFGDGAGALKMYRDYVTQKPTGQFVSYAKARMDVLAKNPADIQKMQTTAERENSAKAQEMFDEAVKQQTAGKYDEAEALYAQLVATYPNEGAYAYARGTNFQGKGDINNAITWYQKAVSLNPTNADYKKVLKTAQEAQTATLVDAGVQKYNQNDFAGAIEEYKKALLVAPNNAKLHTNLAVAYQAMDNFASAREEYKKGYDLDPKGEVDNLYFMGPLDETLGRGAQALQDYTMYLQYAPKGTYAKQANDRYQVLYFDKTKLQKMPTRQEIASQQAAGQAFNDAVALQTEGKLDEAIAKYEEALKSSPNVDSVWYSYGTAKQAKGDVQGAIEAYNKAIALNPKEATYKQTLKQAKQFLADPLVAQAYDKQTKENDIPGAIKLYMDALKLDESATTYGALGTAYQANKNYPQALNSYLKAVGVDPKLADPHYFLGTLYEAMGKPREAKAEYMKYVQMAPTGPYAPDAKARIAAIK
jgi:tetratricopeptide (TPR) repeat protein